MKAMGNFLSVVVTSTPWKTTVPVSSEWTPARILIKVDLPAPFSPRSATISPAFRRMPTSSSACVPPNCFDTPLTVRRSRPAMAPSRSASPRVSWLEPGPATARRSASIGIPPAEHHPLIRHPASVSSCEWRFTSTGSANIGRSDHRVRLYVNQGKGRAGAKPLWPDLPRPRAPGRPRARDPGSLPDLLLPLAKQGELLLEKLAIGKAKSLQGLNGDEPFARRLSVLAADFEFRDPFALTLHLPLDE